jgi:hypothetical protein
MKLPVYLFSAIALLLPFLSRSGVRVPSQCAFALPLAWVPWDPPPVDPSGGGTPVDPPHECPEPSTLVLGGIGAALLASGAWSKWRRARRAAAAQGQFTQRAIQG